MPGTSTSTAVARVARWLGAVVFAFGAVAVVIWLTVPSVVGVVARGYTPIKPASAAALILLGIVLSRPDLARWSRRALLSGAGLIALDGLLAVVLDTDLVFSGPLFLDTWREYSPDGRMAPGTAVALLLVASGVAAARRSHAVTTVCGLTAFAIAYVSLLGHLYGVGDLYTIQSATEMAGPTAVALIAASVSMVLHSDRMPVSRALQARGTPGALVRRLLPWAFLAPPLIGWALLRGEVVGLFGPEFGVSLMVLAMVAATIAVILVGARTAATVDRERESAADDLEALNAVLSERVAAAVAEAEEGRERLQLVLERTPVGIFETDPDGVRRFTNRRWRELAGVQDGDGSGAAWTDSLHPDDRDRVEAEWAEALVGGREWSSRYRYDRPDGKVTWVDSTALAIRGSDGTVTRWLGSVTDVTDQVEAQRRLADSESRYRSVVATMAEGVVLQDAEGVIVTANDAACRVLGLELEQLLGGRSVDPRWRAVREDGSDFPAAERPSPVALGTGTSVRDVTLGVHRTDGTLVWLEVAAEPLLETRPDGTSAVVGVVTTFSDVTAQRAAARALARSEEQFRSAMAHAPVGMALVSLDGTFTEVNRALCRLLEYDEAALVGRSFQELTHPDDLGSDLELLDELRAGYVDHYTLEKRYLDSDGEVVWVSVAVSMARDEDDEPAYYIAQMQDITVTRAARQSLAHRALHDPLTGLANRDLLMDRLSHALARSARSGVSTVVLFCDLDHFKAVNDELGHETGDLVLVTVADRLRQVVRPSDTVARLGGDEFVVVVEGLVGWGEQRAFAERVRDILDEPVTVAGQVVGAGASIGVAVARPGDDARSLLRKADATMYRAKARGRGRFEVSEDSEVPDLGPVGP